MVQNTRKNPDKWKIRFGEKDSDTRGADRAPVEMLPSRLAIVNVYQLYNKHVLGGVGQKRRYPEPEKGKGKGKGKNADGNKPEKKEKTGGTYRWGMEKIKSGTIGNVDYDMFGHPMPVEGETRSEYNKRTFAFLNKYNGIELPGAIYRVITESSKAKKAKQDEANKNNAQRDENLNKTKKEQDEVAEQRLKEERAGNPLYILDKLVKENKIHTEPSYGRYEKNPDYSMRDPNNPNDVIDIKNAIKNAIKEKRLPQKPGQPHAIIAVQTTMSTPPKYYFIRNDLSTSRKRKLILSKVKRPMLKKKPITHGNKRRVVMKKKGGKR